MFYVVFNGLHKRIICPKQKRNSTGIREKSSPSNNPKLIPVDKRSGQHREENAG